MAGITPPARPGFKVRLISCSTSYDPIPSASFAAKGIGAGTTVWRRLAVLSPLAVTLRGFRWFPLVPMTCPARVQDRRYCTGVGIADADHQETGGADREWKSRLDWTLEAGAWLVGEDGSRRSFAPSTLPSFHCSSARYVGRPCWDRRREPPTSVNLQDVPGCFIWSDPHALVLRRENKSCHGRSRRHR